MQQTSTKGLQNLERLGGKGDPLRIVQETEFRPYSLMVYKQTRIRHRKIIWDFEIQTDHQIPTRRSAFLIINKKGGSCRLVDFASPA